MLYTSFTCLFVVLQAVYNVVCGLYPFTNAEVIELAGYQCAIEKNEFDRLRDTPESMK